MPLALGGFSVPDDWKQRANAAAFFLLLLQVLGLVAFLTCLFGCS